MIVGLTVLRNALRIGYPFVEAILSVLPICDHFHIGEGYSDDGTYECLLRLQRLYDKISISRYEWPQMDTGFAIGAATNAALEHVRPYGGYILYVQADELWSPKNLPVLKSLPSSGYDSFLFPFLHLEHNCQRIQKGAGYHWAIRMVANVPSIIAYRDAWTFTGVSRTLKVDFMPCPIVHCNRCFWHNIPVKLQVQAEVLYRDLGHYRQAAKDSMELYQSRSEPPEEFLRTTSPFAECLPPLFMPMLGQTRYYVREELLAQRI